MPMPSTCEHLVEASRRAHAVEPSARGCTECLASGSGWVHLRLCLTCGHVGCCDSSPNRHATKHFHATQHPVVQSFEPGEEWAWCYAHEAGARSIPSFAGESPAGHLAPPG
jgi:uncharacterized UBP type Zn finger protein